MTAKMTIMKYTMAVINRKALRSTQFSLIEEKVLITIKFYF